MTPWGCRVIRSCEISEAPRVEREKPHPMMMPPNDETLYWSDHADANELEAEARQ